jgi:hypothetical protein
MIIELNNIKFPDLKPTESKELSIKINNIIK